MPAVHVLLQDKLKAVAAAGYTSFDTADIYGPSEGAHSLLMSLISPPRQIQAEGRQGRHAQQSPAYSESSNSCNTNLAAASAQLQGSCWSTLQQMAATMLHSHNQMQSRFHEGPLWTQHSYEAVVSSVEELGHVDLFCRHVCTRHPGRLPAAVGCRWQPAPAAAHQVCAQHIQLTAHTCVS